jgi:SAM-dependent methyltransferase
LNLLEVGCGNGELASRLQSLGYRVTALDSSPEAIQQTKKLGVDARVADWPDLDLESESFDVILFTRSLHHIRPLAKAVDKASTLLRSNGLVLIEDFAFDELSSEAVAWFYDILTSLHASKVLYLTNENFCKDLLVEGGHVETWRRHHDHDLHPWRLMLSTLKSAFDSVVETSAPYLYRYLCPVLADDENGYRIATHVLELEKQLETISPGRLIGRRFAGRKTPGEAFLKPNRND